MLDSKKDFFTAYMDYCNIEQSESPAIYHRWTCASILGALLGRNVHMHLGPFLIYPNQYIMLMGEPAARKGSALGVGKSLLKASGFTRFAADKTSKERFLMDMKQFDLSPSTDIADLEIMAFDEPAETYVCSGEFTDFIGQNNMEFVTMLTNLWDNLPEYVNPKITGKSVRVEKPTVNLIGANTPEGFSLAFPPEALGNGFLSRVVMVYGEPSGRRIAWPEPLDPIITEALILHIQEMQKSMKGEIGVTVAAKNLATRIYAEDVPIDDPRFAHYKQRRYIHLLKLALIMAVVNLRPVIEEVHLIRANTMLAMAEKKMPLALGEFGSSKYNVVTGKILSFLHRQEFPKTPNEIYRAVHTDISKISELTEILSGLKQADKIQPVQYKGKAGYMVKREAPKEWPAHMLDLDWLTDSERI